MIWWIDEEKSIRKGEREDPYDRIRISYYGDNYKVWKVHSSQYDNYTLLFVTDSLEAALMYGLEYMENTR